MTHPHIDSRARFLDVIQGLQRLPMAATVLHLGAHPDDEESGLLAYLTKKYSARAVYWSATRGESGQNMISPYSGSSLGVYRTWESLAAREIDGAEALFGPFIDFGYSKTAEETLAKWGRTDVLRELVRAIRTVQPHIVISRWSGDERDEHGHHKAIGTLVAEAVEAAAQPTRFGELSRAGLHPWRPAKVYVSMGGDWQPGQGVAMGQRNPSFEAPGFARINTGEFDPLTGQTYQSLGWVALNSHKTQGLGVLPEFGDFFYYYSSISRPDGLAPSFEHSFYDGMDPTLQGLKSYPGNRSAYVEASLEEVISKCAGALGHFRDGRSSDAAGDLLDAKELLGGLIHRTQADPDISREVAGAMTRYYERKAADVERMAVACLGVRTQAVLDQARATPGQDVRLACELWNPLEASIEAVEFSVRLPKDWSWAESSNSGSKSDGGLAGHSTFQLTIPSSAELSSPYWLKHPPGKYQYTVLDNGPHGLPFGEPPVSVESRFEFNGRSVSTHVPAALKDIFPGGYKTVPLAVVPPISMSPRNLQELLLCSEHGQSVELTALASCNATHVPVEGMLSVNIPDGWSVTPAQVQLAFSEKEESRSLRFQLTIPPDAAAAEYAVTYRVHCDGRDYDVMLDTVRLGVPGIPKLPDGKTNLCEEFTTRPARVAITIADVRLVKGYKYAYIPGADDHLLPSLRHFQLNLRIVAEHRLSHLDLDQFDAVIVGVNAFLIRKDVQDSARRLLDYVHEGGTLIVQQQGYGYDERGNAPFPFSYNRPHDRVTSETAPVSILDPDDPLLKFPNLIGAHDFDGWVHDRGKYFFGQWDAHYKPLLSMSDPGEPTKEGALIVASYGRGTYVYSGLSFARQLSAGVQGAIRLVANVLAVPAARIMVRVARLKNTPLFSAFDDAALETIAKIMYDERFESGHYLCREGDIGDELYLITSGAVEIVRENGARNALHTAQAGELVGELAALSNITRSASMRAKGDVSVFVVKGVHFRELMHAHRHLTDTVIRTLVERLVASNG